jgi:rhodanese-related sulfurtransferase
MIDQVHPRDLAAWLQAAQTHGQPLVLDVREPWELQTASVRAEGFELMSMPMRAIPVRLQELDAARPIACLCHHGGRSMQVAAFLKHHGFAHVANIAGGIDAWSREVDPGVPRY